MDKVRETPFEELPTGKKVLERIQRKDGTLSYQTAELKFYKNGLEYIKSHHVEWVEAIEACLLQRLRSQTRVGVAYTCHHYSCNSWMAAI